MGAFTGRTHQFRLHAAAGADPQKGMWSGGLFSRKKPYQEVP